MLCFIGVSSKNMDMFEYNWRLLVVLRSFNLRDFYVIGPVFETCFVFSIVWVLVIDVLLFVYRLNNPLQMQN